MCGQAHIGKRMKYRNGDPIHMPANGCDGCCPCAVNGVLCHEDGCPDAWRDSTVDCFECGCQFHPTARRQTLCPDCLEVNHA